MAANKELHDNTTTKPKFIYSEDLSTYINNTVDTSNNKLLL
jgi:hypothetical protein